MSNRLAKESSPYLLQHAHNPVDWYPWGEEAFEKARAENKPVLVSIGYAACHWCHVMERESFENQEVAALMNEHLVNIKVDREERPDVDHIYMDAVQAISGSGGWPLNVFLTPDGRPFYGGTYFPPRRAFNRASWTEVLTAVVRSFQEKRDEIDQQANNLTEHLQASNSFGLLAEPAEFTEAVFETAVGNLLKQADTEWGGFGRAPKFPQSFAINFLLQYAWYQKEDSPQNALSSEAATGGGAALAQALLSLDKMRQGGIYDHIGGGFARYSTDTEWLAPHFEKMLYDNALLVCTYADAYALTKNEAYRQVIEETLLFVERELTHPDGGFYSALDADSEGEEGKFYVWDREEVNRVLGAEAQIFCDYFDIKPGGNWKGKTIPRTKLPLTEFAAANGLDEDILTALIADGRQKLFEERSKRIRPLLDDKVLLNWNALMNIAYSRAYAVTGNPQYKAAAEKNMRFLLSAFVQNGSLHHSWKNETARHPPFLDDYAFLIAALIELAQATSDFSFLDRAAAFAETVLEKYADVESPYFFYTASDQTDVLLRKKELYDGATPSGNAVMAYNLYRLSILLDKPDWRERAEEMAKGMSQAAVKYPASFGVWLSLLYELTKGTAEIAVVGRDYERLSNELRRVFIPHKVLMASEQESAGYPLLAGKKTGVETHIFLCRNYACKKPVSTLKEALALVSAK